MGPASSSRGEADRSHASKLFTTIASQLAERLPTLAVHVKEAIEADTVIYTRALREQFDRLILQPLSKIQGEAYSGAFVAIVVDALDECGRDEDIRIIISLFSRAKVLQSPRLRVFLTSRPELPVRLGFKAVQGTYHDLILHEISTTVVRKDILAFIQYELNKIRAEYNLSVAEDRRLPVYWPDQHTTDTLVELAMPLFISAATVCRFINDRQLGNPKRQLQKLLDHKRALHFGLNPTYQLILNQQIKTFFPRR